MCKKTSGMIRMCLPTERGTSTKHWIVLNFEFAVFFLLLISENSMFELYIDKSEVVSQLSLFIVGSCLEDISRLLRLPVFSGCC